MILTPPVQDPVPRGLCTDCGVSRMKDPSACGQACQFIAPDYPAMEHQVHGQSRGEGDELFFGPFQAMYRARMTHPLSGAQWTGITTSIAANLLQEKAVDAVLCMIPDPEDVWKPQPALITSPDDMATNTVAETNWNSHRKQSACCPHTIGRVMSANWKT